jgi:hypothetical protein
MFRRSNVIDPRPRRESSHGAPAYVQRDGVVRRTENQRLDGVVRTELCATARQQLLAAAKASSHRLARHFGRDAENALNTPADLQPASVVPAEDPLLVDVAGLGNATHGSRLAEVSVHDDGRHVEGVVKQDLAGTFAGLGDVR